MINLLAESVQEALRVGDYPVDCVYGPLPVTYERYPHGLLVFERARDASDTFAAPMGTRNQNPLYRAARTVAAQLLIYACAEQLEGARIEDHEGECEDLVDQTYIAIEEWAKLITHAGPTIVEARYLSAAERNDEQVWPGVVYRVKFSVLRAVVKQSKSGEIRPTGKAAAVANRTEVKYPLRPNDPPAIGCGTPE